MRRVIFFLCLTIGSVQSFCQISYQKTFSGYFTLMDTACPDNQIYSYFQNFIINTLFEPGYPALPDIPVKLLIPTGSTIDSIQIQKGDSLEIFIEHRIFPYQSPSTTCRTVLGEVVVKYFLTDSKDHLLIPTNDFTTGVYLATVIYKNKIIESCRFIVLK